MDGVALAAAFDRDYAATFGRTVPGGVVEVTVWSVLATTPAPQSAQLPPAPDRAEPLPAAATRPLFDAGRQEQGDALTLPRDALPVGAALPGPAIITEDETTIILPRGFSAQRLTDGTIDCRTGAP
jgi:N-methylhydantoinase A/oxoprolinase/acetone carboxylase beta subunit